MTSEHPGHSMAEIILANLRRTGWTVAVHNDFRLNGKPHTFWLFTHEATRKYAKGEGTTDQEALEEAAHEAAVAMDAPVAFAVPEIPGHPHVSLEDARRAVADAGRWVDAAIAAGNDPAKLTDLGTAKLVAALAKQLGDAIAVIETRFAAPDVFYDAEEAGDALRAGTAAFVDLEGYQTLLVDFHKRHHEGALNVCPVPICAEGRGHLPRVTPDSDEEGAARAIETLTDPYLKFAAEAYGCAVTEVTAAQRTRAKRATYWLAYGADITKAAGELGVDNSRVLAACEAVLPALTPPEDPEPLL